ncbi:transporter substrate-binding domain-containing protein [Paraburkholderia sp. D1E]|uniref:transporter substrate-binding domain-containing protein n=1 Tax=Paraburkholderia sp. D1E TaxID=3461398 RepID=UPI00404601F0
MGSLIHRQLAPRGVLRAAVNLANSLLVSGLDADGNPVGIAPDLAHSIARELDVPLACVSFTSPVELADAADSDVWDICLIAVDPAREHRIAFTAPYAEIQATYLVHPSSTLDSILEVDRPGVRVAVASGSAYDLWLTRHLTHASLLRLKTHDEALAAVAKEQADVLAGLWPTLLGNESTLPGSRLLEGCFTAIQQAVGTHRRNEAGARFLRAAVENARASGFVNDAIRRYGVRGLHVAAAPAH